MFIHRQIGLDNLTSLVQDKGPLTLLRWSKKRKSEDKFFSSSKSQKSLKLGKKYNTYIFGTICRLKGGGTNRVTLRNEQKQGKVLETSELNLQLCKNSFFFKKSFLVILSGSLAQSVTLRNEQNREKF